MFRVEHANHLAFLNAEHSGGSDGGRSRHADGLAGKAPFPQKIARSKDTYDCLFAAFVNDGEFYATFLDLLAEHMRDEGFDTAGNSPCERQ